MDDTADLHQFIGAVVTEYLGKGLVDEQQLSVSRDVDADDRVLDQAAIVFLAFAQRAFGFLALADIVTDRDGSAVGHFPVGRKNPAIA